MHGIDAVGGGDRQKIGVVMMIVGPMSIKVPSKSIRTLRRRRIMIGLSDSPCIQSTSVAGTRRNAISQEKAAAVPMMRRDHGGGAHRAHRRVNEVGPSQLPIDEGGDKECVEDGDAGALGRREDAGPHAAEDDRDEKEAGNGGGQEMADHEEPLEGLGRIAALSRHDIAVTISEAARSRPGMMPAVKRSAIEMRPPAEIE